MRKLELKTCDYGEAIFSECGQYRYLLTRNLDGSKGPVNFIMLNPSTATHEADDPTIRRCIGYAKAWGHSRLYITNIFALRSTDPSALKIHGDPIGTENNQFLKNYAAMADMVIAAWGTHGTLKNRGNDVRLMLGAQQNVYALKVSKDRHPCHPLYLKADLQPFLYEGSPTEARA